MKKIITSMIAAMLIVGCLAGCGGSGSGNGGSTSSPESATGTPAASAEPSATGEGSASPAASKSDDIAYIEDKGSLVIGITLFAPMNYLDDNGVMTGFETEFAEAVCEKLGVKPEFQEITWSAKETELNAKNIDCIWNGLTIDADRSANMSISQPYMENTQVLVVKSENADAMKQSVEGKAIAAEADSAGETVCESEDFFSKANYTAVDAQSKALMEVASGTSDGCVIDYIMSKVSIGEGTDFSDLVVVDGLTFGEEQYGIAFRKEDKGLTNRVNEIINELIESGELQKIADKYNLGDMLITK